MTTQKNQPRRRLAWNIVVFIAFLLTAQLGTYFYRGLGTSPATIWAPVGIAFAGIILGGYHVLPAIVLAAASNGFLNGNPPIIIAGAILGNALQPLLAYHFLKSAKLNRKLANVKDIFLILGTSIFITMIVPTINALTINLYNNLFGGSRNTFWVSWWVGGMLSALILTPLLIRWVRYPISKDIKSKMAEITAAIFTLCVISYFLFATPHTTIGNFSLIYPLLAVLLWITFRANSRIMTLALFLMTLISLLGALYGDYNPTAAGLSGRVFNTQVFDIIIAVIFLILVSIEEQRKHAVAAMRDRNAQLEVALDNIRQSEGAKNEFITTLAHELRNPLASFLSSIELLLLDSSMKSADRKKLAEAMLGRVKTMGRLLDDLLDVSRITRGQMELKKELVDLQKIVREAVHVVQPLIRNRRHSLNLALPEEAVILDADPVRLEQILVNLLTNAAKFTPPGGRIDLTGKCEDGWITLCVADTGVGIPPNMITRVFESFVQVKGSSKAASGLGIGLALTKNLVEMHNGTITVKSSDQGSEFVVRLPAYLPAEEIKKREPGKTTRMVEKGKFRILVVDDNVEAALGMGKLLTLRGHRVEVVHNGQDALKKIAEASPDVVLLDIGLPDMDGYEVAKKLASQDKAPILVAVTGYGQFEDRERTKEAGFRHHLVKPAGLADVEEVLRQIVAPSQ